jgi:hypothetical protein
VEQESTGPYAVGQGGMVPGAVIKICLVGDFGSAGAGPAQMRQLQALVKSLQQQCQIPSENISLASSGKLGKNQWRLFPLHEVQQLTD